MESAYTNSVGGLVG